MDGLYTYALVSTLYNEKGDYIDCFLPFVVSVIDSKISNTLDELQGRVKEKYGLEIPAHSLKTILTRGTRKDYAAVDHKQYSLTDKGSQFNASIEHKETRREINGFLSELENYVKKAGYNNIQIERIFQEYVFSNLKSLFFFIDTETYVIEDKNQNKIFPYITDFINSIEKTNSALFKVFQNIVFGKIISLAISGSQDIVELQENFSKTTLFLDTNVVFDILGLQGNEAQKVTIEFVRLAQKSKKFNLKVFDFTVDEIIRVISNYASQSHKYFSEVKVDSIYCYLKAKGWKNNDASHFIQNIEQKLNEKDIQILTTEKFKSNAEFSEITVKLSQLKPDRSPVSYEHDLRAIYEIMKIRSNRVNKFERAKCFFLSQDFKLARFDFREFEHKQYQSVPEVMLEQTLTNLIWLKEPKEIPLNALISFHKRYAVVEKNVWEIFYGKILQAKDNDKEFYNDTTTLLCHNQLNTTLANLEPDATEEDVESVVKNGAAIVRQHEEKERNKLLEKQKLEFEKIFDAQVEQVKADKDNKLVEIRNTNIEALIKHRDKAVGKAAKKSDNVWNLFRALLTLVLLGVGISFSSTICSQWQKLEPLAWVVCLLISLLIGIWGVNITGLKAKLDRYYIRKKLSDIHFEELMKSLDVNQSDLK
jgi:hypothetical protein